MTALLITSGVVVSYLVGSIPTSIWYGRWKKGIDIRDHGSGNAGATNTFRVLGAKAGSIVMFFDVLKGFLATFSPRFLVDFGVILTVNEGLWVQIGFGFAAVLGHIFPIYERFKGGKGVATLLGMVIAMHPPIALTCLGVFLVVFFITKYVSVGSMTAGLVFPILTLIPFYNGGQYNPIMLGFGIVIFALLVFTHKKNIRRLIKGEENKISFGAKKKS